MSAVIFCASLRHGDGNAFSFAASDLNIVAMAAVATPAAFVDGVVPAAAAAVLAGVVLLECLQETVGKCVCRRRM